MKKLFFALSALILLSACGSSDIDVEKARRFGTDFGDLVSKNAKTEIVKLYPDARDADSLALSFNPDSVEVEVRSDSAIISYGRDRSITVKPSEEGFTVVSSHGLFAYPEEDMDFARATGQWKAALTDVQNARRMADTGFRISLLSQFEDRLRAITTSIHTTKIPTDGAPGEREVAVTNPTEYSLDSLDFKMLEYWSAMTLEGTKQWDEERKIPSLPADSTVTYPTRCTSQEGITASSFRLDAPVSAVYLRVVRPTGAEYDAYLKKRSR